MKENLLRDAGINDKARKVTLRGKQVIVPLKFDEDGEPATADKLIFKRLSLRDLRFLSVWRKLGFDSSIETVASKASLDVGSAERLIKRLSCFRDEDAKVKALCEIPTPDWIAAKHVENVYNPTLEDSQQKSLAELAKIEGAYKQQTPATQINVFNLPKLTPEVEAEFKALAEKALDTEQVA